ncbi:MAG TPA: hypothetical protein VII29_08500, partial [Terriglobales bacterium]
VSIPDPLSDVLPDGDLFPVWKLSDFFWGYHLPLRRNMNMPWSFDGSTKATVVNRPGFAGGHFV